MISKTIVKIFQYIFYGTFTLLFISLCFFNKASYGLETAYQLLAAGIIAIIAIIIALKIHNSGCIKKYIKNERWLLVGVVVILFSIQIIIAINIRTDIGWDVGGLITDAKKDNAIGNVFYYCIYPNNLFLYFIIRAFIQRIFPVLNITDIFMALSVINIIAIDAALIFMYSAAKKVYGRTTGAVSFAIATPLIGLSPWMIVPYSDTFSMPLIMGAFYFYLQGRREEKRWKKVLYLLLTGVCLVVGTLIKPQVIILLVGIGIIGVLYLKPNIKQAVPVIFEYSALVLIYAVLLSGFIYYRNTQKSLPIITDMSMPPTHYISMGLSSTEREAGKAYGAYSQKDVEFSFQFRSTAEKNEANIIRIKEKLSKMGPLGYAQFITNKARWITSEGFFYWGGEGNFADYAQRSESVFTEFYYPTGKYFRVYLYLSQGIWIVTMLFMVGAFFFTRKKEPKKETVIIQCAIFGLLCFILLFEGRSRYLFHQLPFFAILAAAGLTQFTSWMGQKMQKS